MFSKVLVMHNHAIGDFAEMLKEVFSEIRLFLKPRSVQHHDALTTGWFVKLYPEIHVETCYKWFNDKVKLKVVELHFALVVKCIFNGENKSHDLSIHSSVRTINVLRQCMSKFGHHMVDSH